MSSLWGQRSHSTSRCLGFSDPAQLSVALLVSPGWNLMFPFFGLCHMVIPGTCFRGATRCGSCPLPRAALLAKDKRQIRSEDSWAPKWAKAHTQGNLCPPEGGSLGKPPSCLPQHGLLFPTPLTRQVCKVVKSVPLDARQWAWQTPFSFLLTRLPSLLPPGCAQPNNTGL